MSKFITWLKGPMVSYRLTNLQVSGLVAGTAVMSVGVFGLMDNLFNAYPEIFGKSMLSLPWLSGIYLVLGLVILVLACRKVKPEK